VAVHVRRRALAVLFGLLCAFVLLEGGLRVAGWAARGAQRRANARALAEGADIRVLCVGESTTEVGGYPRLLEEILDGAGSGRSYSVFNLGRSGEDSTTILAELPDNLDRLRPHVVVAMMGANDPVRTADDRRLQGTRRAVPDRGLSDRGALSRHLRTARLAELLWFSVVEDGGLATAGEGGGDWAYTGPGDGAPAYRGDSAAGSGVRPPARPSDVLSASTGEFLDELLPALLEREPTEARVPVEAALALESRGDDAGALTSYMEVTDREPGGALAPFAAGRVLCRTGSCADAEEYLARAVEREPAFGCGYVALGVCFDGAGRFEAADRAYARALVLRRGLPFVVDDPDLRTRLAALYAVPGREHMLYDWLEEPVSGRGNPSDPRHDIERIDVLEASGRHEELAEVFTGILAGDPTLEVVNRIARYHREHGQPERQAEVAARALAVSQLQDRSVTRSSYLRMQEILDTRGIQLVVVQYPTRPLTPLVELVDWNGDVAFVDNEALFRDALAEEPYETLFWDACFGDFGHTTERGSRLLAGNVARVILTLSE
jgi:tetratricopeptide (TPR) repeat protein